MSAGTPNVYDRPMDVSDRIELHELPGRYGDAIDDRDWDGLGRIFTEDATFDLTDLGVPMLTGLAAIKQFMEVDAEHPLTHMMTNIYVDERPQRVTMNFRVVALRKGGFVSTASYYDVVLRTALGWRVLERVTTRRRRSNHVVDSPTKAGGAQYRGATP